LVELRNESKTKDIQIQGGEFWSLIQITDKD
jgi:hypothetical protein